MPALLQLSAADSGAVASSPGDTDAVVSVTGEKYIGVLLASLSSLLIGASFIFTKIGLNDTSPQFQEQRERQQRLHMRLPEAPGLSNVAAETMSCPLPLPSTDLQCDSPASLGSPLSPVSAASPSSSDTHAYLRSPMWWMGMCAMVGGEAVNFAAYSFAPALLVTPLGALSVLIGALLAKVFLKERLGREGILGCGLCLVGSVIVVMHAPEDPPVTSVEEIVACALKPGFLVYACLVIVASLILIFWAGPRYGRKTLLVYVSICSLLGSISVMAAKALGLALRLSIVGGANQFARPSTWGFLVIVLASALTQINYFNKALDAFSTNLVTPVYYVMFTTATITASLVLFGSMPNAPAASSDPVSVASALCGFIVIFLGVFLLNHKPTQSTAYRHQTTSSTQHEIMLTPTNTLSRKTSNALPKSGSASRLNAVVLRAAQMLSPEIAAKLVATSEQEQRQHQQQQQQMPVHRDVQPPKGDPAAGTFPLSPILNTRGRAQGYTRLESSLKNPDYSDPNSNEPMSTNVNERADSNSKPTL